MTPGWVEDEPLDRPRALTPRITVGPIGRGGEFIDGPAADLVVDARGTFGAGTHPSTVLVVGEISRRLRPGQRLIDVGSGSGIVALVAARLGARALGIDRDATSVAVAEANRIANGIPASDDDAATQQGERSQPGGSACFRHIALEEFGRSPDPRSGPGPGWSRGRFDLVAANLPAHTLLASARSLADLVERDGALAASGLLLHEVTGVERALAACGLRVVDRRGLSGWALMVADRAPVAG